MITKAIQILFIMSIWVISVFMTHALYAKMTINEHADRITYLAYSSDKTAMFETCRDLILKDSFLVGFNPSAHSYKKAKSICAYELFSLEQ